MRRMFWAAGLTLCCFHVDAMVLYSSDDYPYYDDCETEVVRYCSDIDYSLNTCMERYMDELDAPCYDSFVAFGEDFWGDGWFREHRRDDARVRHEADYTHFDQRTEPHDPGQARALREPVRVGGSRGDNIYSEHFEGMAPMHGGVGGHFGGGAPRR